MPAPLTALRKFAYSPSVVTLGSQILADLYGCDRGILDDPEAIRAILVEAAQRCGATIVDRCFHRFSPQGISGVVIIAESHLGIHTWPEHGYAAVDLFTCGRSLRTDDCFHYLREALRCQKYRAQVIARGLSAELIAPEPALTASTDASIPAAMEK